jgi:hypothetical protein
MAIVVLLVLLALAIFGSRRFGNEIDCMARAHVVSELLVHHTFFLDDYPDIGARAGMNIHGHWVPKYSIGVPVLSLPFFLGTRGLAHPMAHWRRVRQRSRRAAGFVVLAVALLLYRHSVRVTGSTGAAVGLSVAIVLGTTLWSSASQDIWEHGFIAFFLVAILGLTSREQVRPVDGFAVGVCLGLTLVCRPAGIVPAAVLSTPALLAVPSAVGLFIGTVPFVTIQAWYSCTHIGRFALSGYGAESTLFTSPLATGLAGILLSPSRGLFVYSPFLLLAPAAIGLSWSSLPAISRRTVVLIAVATFAHTAMIAKWHDWAGGWSYGPRLMTEAAVLVGFVFIMTYKAWRQRSKFVAAFIVLCCVSASIHGLQVFWPNDKWNEMNSADLEAAAFRPTESQIAMHFRTALRDIAARRSSSSGS